MEGALIGLAGLLIGILLNEYYRRNSRIEKYSDKVFEKRLKVYEGLMSEIKNASRIINGLVDVTDLSLEQKTEIAFTAGLKVVEYTDEQEFYLNEEISIHCGLVFVTTADIFEEHDNKQHLLDFRNGVKDAYQLIRSESGIEELDGLFRSITKSSPGGRLIESFRELKKAHDKKA